MRLSRPVATAYLYIVLSMELVLPTQLAQQDNTLVLVRASTSVKHAETLTLLQEIASPATMLLISNLTTVTAFQSISPAALVNGSLVVPA